MTSVRNRSTAIAPWILLAVVLVFVGTRDSTTAAGTPANKAAAAATSEEIFSPNENKLLLSKTIKAGGPIDLILQLSAQCSILTDVETIGDDDQEAEGRIEMWVTLDSADPTKKVVTNGPGDHSVGRAVFCDRTYRRETLEFASEDGEDDEGDETIRSYFRTRSTHSYDWIALDIGSGMHTIRVWGTLTHATRCGGEGCTVNPNTKAEAVVGNRTLVIEPTRFARGADTISN